MIDKLTGEGGEDEEVKKIINIFNFKQRLLSIDMSLGSFSCFQSFKFSNFSGSQRLSDFQKFLAENQLYDI